MFVQGNVVVPTSYEFSTHGVQAKIMEADNHANPMTK
jgi:hypothetical protein